MNLIVRLHNRLYKVGVYSALFDYICQQIIPGIYAKWANGKVDTQYNSTLKKKVAPFPAAFNIEETLEQLKDEFDKQRERKKAIEDKAKTLFATISISVTAITFTLNYNNLNLQTKLGSLGMAVLVASIVYIIMGSIRAMQTINIRAMHVFQTEISDQGNDIVVADIGNKHKQLENLAKAKILNDKIITKVSNYGWASAIDVRNGIVLFAVYFIIALTNKAKIEAVHDTKITYSDSVLISSINGISNTLKSHAPVTSNGTIKNGSVSNSSIPPHSDTAVKKGH